MKSGGELPLARFRKMFGDTYDAFRSCAADLGVFNRCLRMRSAQLGYESMDEYLMALALQDLTRRDDSTHELPLRISSLSPAKQERIDRQILQHVRRGES